MCVPKNCAVFDLYLMKRKISLHLWKIHTLESKKSHGVGVFPLVDHLQVTWLRNLGQLEVSHVVASLVHLNVQGFCGSLPWLVRLASRGQDQRPHWSEATKTNAVSPRSVQRRGAGESGAGSDGTPKHWGPGSLDTRLKARVIGGPRKHTCEGIL